MKFARRTLMNFRGVLMSGRCKECNVSVMGFCEYSICHYCGWLYCMQCIKTHDIWDNGQCTRSKYPSPILHVRLMR